MLSVPLSPGLSTAEDIPLTYYEYTYRDGSSPVLSNSLVVEPDKTVREAQDIVRLADGSLVAAVLTVGSSLYWIDPSDGVSTEIESFFPELGFSRDVQLVPFGSDGLVEDLSAGHQAMWREVVKASLPL